jgi:hypothetical protein
VGPRRSYLRNALRVSTAVDADASMDLISLTLLDGFILCRYPPFYADDRMQLYQAILAGKIEYPRHIKKEAR